MKCSLRREGDDLLEFKRRWIGRSREAHCWEWREGVGRQRDDVMVLGKTSLWMCSEMEAKTGMEKKRNDEKSEVLGEGRKEGRNREAKS